jgi:hypothetical protein
VTTRALAKSVLEPDWTLSGAVTCVKPHEVTEAILSMEQALLPLSETDPDLKQSQAAKALDIALRPIGCKLDPRMAPAQAGAWRDSVMMSLSKWPARIAIAAAKAGIHETFQYGIGDVDARLHELAAKIDAKQQLALHRLRLLAAEFDRMANPLPQIAEQPHIWTQAEIDETNAGFKRLGIRTRYRLGPDGTCETEELAEVPRGEPGERQEVGA